MKIVLLTFLSLALTCIQAQPEAEVRLYQIKSEANQNCFSLDIKQNTSDRLLLSGQIYRLFYSSASMEFDEGSLYLNLDEELYTLKMVQHQNHVDGSHIGKLPFDKDLGFINLSMTLNGTNTRGNYLPADGSWLSVASMCFSVTDKEASRDIILARSNLTSDYGRAYVELSYVDENGAIHNLPVSTQGDIHLPGKS